MVSERLYFVPQFFVDILILGGSVFQSIYRSHQLSLLCCMELVELLLVHRYSGDIFPYSGPIGMLSSE